MNIAVCNICHVDFDEEEHQPLHLGCSHDACAACVKGLINGGSLMCPMCRAVVEADTPKDLKVNHGIVQVLRKLKEFKLSEGNVLLEEINTKNTEICRIHKQSFYMRCVSCKIGICVQCKEMHTEDIGCQVLDNTGYLDKLKEEHKKKVVPTLLSLKEEVQSHSSLIVKLDSEKEKLEENFIAEKNRYENEKKKIEEKKKKLIKVFNEGNKTYDEIEASAINVEKSSSLIEFNQCVNLFNDIQQFARIWSKKNASSIIQEICQESGNTVVLVPPLKTPWVLPGGPFQAHIELDFSDSD